MAGFDEQTAAAVDLLRLDEGEWDAEIEVTPPGAPASRSKGRATNRIIGGRWLTIDYVADSGFEGHGVYGWDSHASEFVGIWVDTMQAHIAHSRGRYDAATATMTYQTETQHGGQPVRYLEITTRHPDGTREYRNVLSMPDGSQHQMMRVIYSRR